VPACQAIYSWHWQAGTTTLYRSQQSILLLVLQGGFSGYSSSWRDFAIFHKITDPGKDIAKAIDGQLGKLNKLNYLAKGVITNY
jgi:hypothetical protein